MLKLKVKPETASAILLKVAIEDTLSCNGALGQHTEEVTVIRHQVAIDTISGGDFISLYGECLLLLECCFCRHDITMRNRQETLAALLAHLIVSKTVGEVFQKVMGFNAFLQERKYSISLESTGGIAQLNINLAPMIEGAPVSLIYGINLFYYNLVVWLTNRDIDLNGMGLPAHVKGRSERLDALFDMDIIHGGQGSYLLFAQEVLDYPVVRSPYDIAYAVNTLSRDPFFFARGETLLRARVRSLLQKMAREERRLPDAGTVAIAFDMGASTFARYLKVEGTSFLQLKHEVQKEQAQRMLGKEGQSVREVARHLGYSSARSFRRAFVAWTGVLPSEMRSPPTL